MGWEEGWGVTVQHLGNRSTPCVHAAQSLWPWGQLCLTGSKCFILTSKAVIHHVTTTLLTQRRKLGVCVSQCFPLLEEAWSVVKRFTMTGWLGALLCCLIMNHHAYFRNQFLYFCLSLCLRASLNTDPLLTLTHGEYVETRISTNKLR